MVYRLYFSPLSIERSLSWKILVTLFLGVEHSSELYNYLNNYPKVIVLENSESLYNKLTKMEEGIFIADPFGKIILGYKQDFVAKGFLKDLKKLLKYSKI